MGPARVAAATTAGSTISFAYTGSAQSFVVPAGATMMQVVAVGGKGGNTYSSGGSPSAVNLASGGHGAVVTADIPAPAAGTTVYAMVGGNATVGGNAAGVGGFNGGGAGDSAAGGGGGATDLRTTATDPTTRLLVAGGGGGAGRYGADVNSLCYYAGCPPGAGGSAQNGNANGGSGQTGPMTGATYSYYQSGYTDMVGGQGGGGGTQTAGGAGGTAQTPNSNCSGLFPDGGSPGSAGSLGAGGNGGPMTGCASAGGGGGGGYYGGGGGAGGNGYQTYAMAGGGGGGAGSSWVEATALSASYGVDTSGTPSLTITFNPTTTAVSCIPDPATMGNATTCTATVSNVDPTDFVPAGGTVTWNVVSGAGSFSSTSCTLSGGACSVTFTPTDGSSTSQTLGAAYGGDSAHSPSSGSGALSVLKRQSATVPDCLSFLQPVNVPMTCLVTVSDADAGTPATPTGSVSWSVATGAGSFSPTSCTLSSGFCSVSYTPAPGSEGMQTLQATYNGDAAHLTSSNVAPLLATTRTSALSASCAPGTDPVGAPSSCTATVSDTSPGTAITPTGSVTWTVSSGAGSFTPLSCTLSGGSCSVSYTPATGSEGAQSVSATYAGDTDHSGSYGGASLTATQRTTSTSAACAPSSDAADAPTSCTATVTDTSAGTATTPTGTVTWSVGSGSGSLSAVSCTLSGGSCSVAYVPAAGSEGAQSLLAAYGGDTDHTGSSGTAALSVVQRTSAVTVACAGTFGPVDSPVSCTASVTDTASGTTSTPTGTVTWTASAPGSFSPASCTLVSGSCSTQFMPALGSEGVVSVQAAYAGDIDHAPSNGAGPYTATQRSTSTAVTCGETTDVTCVITVTDTDTGIASTPTGGVALTITGGTGPATCTLSGGTCTVDVTPIGTVQVGASYGGDTDHATSGTSTDTPEASTTTVSSTPDPSVTGQTVTITVTVKPAAPGFGNPHGTVVVSVDGSVAATVTLDSTVDSRAVFTTTALGLGGHTVTAVYSGDPYYTGSTSAAVTQEVDAPVPVPTTGTGGGDGGVSVAVLLGLVGAWLLGRRRMGGAG